MRIWIHSVWWCWLAHSKWRRRTTLLSMETVAYGPQTVTIERWRIRCSHCTVVDEETDFTLTPRTPPPPPTFGGS